MKHIIVTKFGNEPDIFGETLRCGMIGDWEVRKLLKALANDTENYVTYYGKAKWDTDKASSYFENSNVDFIECNSTDDAEAISEIANIDEFHVLLGPHAFYNGGKNIPAWESIKKSIVTERLLERVAPQIKLMNANPNAKLFFYLSDRRFLLQACDLVKVPKKLYAQSLKPSLYFMPHLESNDYTSNFNVSMSVEPFRFDTLWLLDKSYSDYTANIAKTEKLYELVISANQVTSDEEIQHSRLSKIKEFTKHILDKRVCICGKWTSKKFASFVSDKTSWATFLEGVDIEQHQQILKDSKYALVLFNTNDSPKMFIDNFLTPKYWECVFNGCLTFVEGKNLDFIPQELQVANGIELQLKLDKCEEDAEYKSKLEHLQNSLVKQEYFSGQYFTTWLKEQREHI